MAQPLVALGRQQTVAEERDQHPRPETLSEVGGAFDEDLLDLRRAEGHVGAKRPEPNRHEITVVIAPAPHRTDRIGAVRAHHSREQPTLGSSACVAMLIVERPLAVARGMTSTLGWSSLSDRCGGHGATVDPRLRRAPLIGTLVVG